jgi:hypothetical protein
MKITRKQAIRILCELMDQDGIECIASVQDCANKRGNYPGLDDVLIAVGVTKREIKEGCGLKN